MNSLTTKKILRQEIKERVSSLSPNERKESEKRILEQLENNPFFQKAKSVLLFWSLPDEIDTHSFVKKWARQKQLFLPVIQDGKMYIKPYTDEKDMAEGSFKILEPQTLLFGDINQIDVFVIPAVAFDKQNNRLGRGKGFYDKLLCLVSAYKIGIAYPEQIVDVIPTEKHDIKMDIILY